MREYELLFRSRRRNIHDTDKKLTDFGLVVVINLQPQRKTLTLIYILVILMED